MTETLYAALIGDLVASRRDGGQREAVQRELTAIVQELSGRSPFRETLAAPFELQRGDEVQALFRHPSLVVEALQTLTDRMRVAGLEQRIAFGIGYGALSTGELPPAPFQVDRIGTLDGPCFHHARAALERARKRKTWACFQGFSLGSDAGLNAFFELMDGIRRGWTERQTQLTLLTREHGQQKAVAKHLGISPSVVSEGLKAASFEAIQNGEAAARLLLEDLDPTHDPGNTEDS